MHRVSETDHAWAAGIIDGEAAISMTRNRPGVNRRATMSYQVRISVRMTHEPTIRRLHRLYGGTFKLAKQDSRGSRKDAIDTMTALLEQACLDLKQLR